MTAYVWKSNNSVKDILHLDRRPPKCWGPRLQPIEPIGKSGTAQHPGKWHCLNLTLVRLIETCIFSDDFTWSHCNSIGIENAIVIYKFCKCVWSYPVLFSSSSIKLFIIFLSLKVEGIVFFSNKMFYM
jgi:hypothetical protein